MRVQSGHWLDYDPVALVILVVGIGAVALLALLPVPLPLQKAVLLLALLNVALGLLNLVPAAPLDGYKLVLGLLWSATGSERRARRTIARVGRLALFVIPPATVALLTVKPGLGFAVAVMALTLVAQRQLMRRPERPRGSNSR